MAEHRKAESGIASHDEGEALTKSPVLQARFCGCFAGILLAVSRRKKVGGCNVVKNLKKNRLTGSS